MKITESETTRHFQGLVLLPCSNNIMSQAGEGFYAEFPEQWRSCSESTWRIRTPVTRATQSVLSRGITEWFETEYFGRGVPQVSRSPTKILCSSIEKYAL
jgi:hypothetical protein